MNHMKVHLLPVPSDQTTHRYNHNQAHQPQFHIANFPAPRHAPVL